MSSPVEDGSPRQADDVEAAALERFVCGVQEGDPGHIIGIYLYGSAASAGFGPHSDIDVLILTEHSLTADERHGLSTLLLGISGWSGHAEQFPAVAGRRPWDVTSLVRSDIRELSLAPRRDYQYGEWLRADLESGMQPVPVHDADVVILLAAALQSHRTLVGPPLPDVVPAVPRALLDASQRAVLPAITADLAGDARNVLLTLARALHTVQYGTIIPKDDAAVRAAEQLPAPAADLLRAAAREYQGGPALDWEDEECRAEATAGDLLARIEAACASP